MILLLAVVLLVIVGSALCSGTEAALFSVSSVAARQRAETGGAPGKALLRIKERMSRPIATIVILNNVFNIVGSMTVGVLAAQQLGSRWVGVFSAGLTLAVIVGAEIIPKTLGERHALRISLLAARPVLLLTRLMHPLVWAIERVVAPITRGADRPTTNEAEIALLARIGQREGVIGPDEAVLIERVFRLDDATARALMTPRVRLTTLRADRTLAEVRGRIVESQHTRMLVIGDSVDDVIGVARRGALLARLLKGGDDVVVRSMARPVHFVPESLTGDRLLELFRRTRQHLAVVVDEYGGVSGVVTLEDVLEVLTGEIVDETDLETDLQESARRRTEALLRASGAGTGGSDPGSGGPADPGSSPSGSDDDGSSTSGSADPGSSTSGPGSSAGPDRPLERSDPR